MYRNSKYFSSSSITKSILGHCKKQKFASFGVSQAIVEHMYYYIGYNYIDSRLKTSVNDHTVTNSIWQPYF